MMKKSFRTLLFIYLLIISPQILSGELLFIKGMSKDLKLEKYRKKDLREKHTKEFSAFIYTVLSNTQELRIHQMNGETTNEVYISDEGHEAVFRFKHDEMGKRIDGTGEHVTDCLNQGSFNYYHPIKTPLGHFAADILPWLIWGNCREDPSSLEQRIEAYMLDFEEGYEQALSKNEGFYLPRAFKFKETGQSETVAFFAKALEKSDFDFSSYFPDNLNHPEKKDEFLKAVKGGISTILKAQQNQ